MEGIDIDKSKKGEIGTRVAFNINYKEGFYRLRLLRNIDVLDESLNDKLDNIKKSLSEDAC